MEIYLKFYLNDECIQERVQQQGHVQFCLSIFKVFPQFSVTRVHKTLTFDYRDLHSPSKTVAGVTVRSASRPSTIVLKQSPSKTVYSYRQKCDTRLI